MLPLCLLPFSQKSAAGAYRDLDKWNSRQNIFLESISITSFRLHLWLPSCSILSGIRTKILCAFLVSRASYMFCPFNSPWFDHAKNICSNVWWIKIYKNIILPLVLYECNTLYLTLREEGRVFGNKRIFRPKREEIIKCWSKLHNEELHYLNSSPNKIRTIKSRRLRWAVHVARIWRRGMHVAYWWKSQKEINS
jgi:hypothetical protein